MRKSALNIKERSSGRRMAVQAIFALDYDQAGFDSERILSLVVSQNDGEANGFALRLVQLVYGERGHIDALLRAYSRKWRFSRLGNIERAILRVAVGELLFLDTPPAVIINEAVEHAKEFGEVESPRLINAILDSMVKEGALKKEYSRDKKEFKKAQ